MACSCSWPPSGRPPTQAPLRRLLRLGQALGRGRSAGRELATTRRTRSTAQSASRRRPMLGRASAWACQAWTKTTRGRSPPLSALRLGGRRTWVRRTTWTRTILSSWRPRPSAGPCRATYLSWQSAASGITETVRWLPCRALRDWMTMQPRLPDGYASMRYFPWRRRALAGPGRGQCAGGWWPSWRGYDGHAPDPPW